LAGLVLFRAFPPPFERASPFFSPVFPGGPRSPPPPLKNVGGGLCCLAVWENARYLRFFFGPPRHKAKFQTSVHPRYGSPILAWPFLRRFETCPFLLFFARTNRFLPPFVCFPQKVTCCPPHPSLFQPLSVRLLFFWCPSRMAP